MEDMELSNSDGGYEEHPVILSNPYPPITFPFGGTSLVTNSLQYGDNSYTFIAEQQDATASVGICQQIIQALQLRCQTEKQLTKRNFVLPTQSASEQASIKLPLGVKLSDYITTPAPDLTDPQNNNNNNKRAAIVIDCEMVGVRPQSSEPQPPSQQRPPPVRNPTNTTNTTATNKANKSRPRTTPPPVWERSELAQLCAVDAITGEILIDQLVQPAGHVRNWRTKYSGINAAKLREAQNAGTLLPHWKDARALLLKYMDSETVLIGHSVENDLQMLRLAHGRVVDTSMQTAAAVFGHRLDSFPRIWSLQNLVGRLTGKVIQVKGGGDPAGSSRSDTKAHTVSHDCVEDTLAARELTLWCVLHPAGLAAWGWEMRKEIAEKKAAEEEKRRQEEERKRLKAERKAAAAAAAKAREEEQARIERELREICDEVWPSLEPRRSGF
ncbi:Exonuclease- RNase T/DNA polymerase III [Apiospora rasikravindrae]|uniref:Exonuclease- RNase T/DNA polymerase III n=1 Tax=Apiospora rasikravindrae TaxID=990691 RepID=A0ABR1U807_9PEZI